jgi:AbrB family looped-hinge helix DNA binding protein
MKTKIDVAGRVVVPKALRDALGLRPGQVLEIRADDGKIEIEHPRRPWFASSGAARASSRSPRRRCRP